MKEPHAPIVSPPLWLPRPTWGSRVPKSIVETRAVWAELERRRARRQISVQACSYELMDTGDTDSATSETRSAYSLNQSRDGMALLLGHELAPAQCLEVHTTLSFGRRSVSLFEVRWTKLIRIEGEGDLHLVGCRRLSDPCQYLQF